MSQYETEIELNLSGNAGRSLADMAAALLGLKTGANDLQNSLNSVKTILAGIAEVEIGGKMVKAFERAIDKARELARIHNEMVQIGAGDQVASFDDHARRLSAQYRNLSVIEIQKGMRDAIPIFGSADQAGREFGAVAEFMSTMKAKFGAESGGEINRQVQAAIKAAEESGAMRPEDVGAFLKNEQKMLFAYGDQVSPMSMLTVQRNLGAYQKDLDDHFRFGILPAMAINQGQRAGTEIATSSAKMVAGIRNSSRALDTMISLGILSEDDVELNDKGRPVHIKVGHKTALTDSWDRDPLSAVTKDLLPRIIEKYGNDPIVMRQVIGNMFGDKTAISGVTDLAINALRYEKDARNVAAVSGDFGPYRERSGDYASQSITAQKENLQTALGMPAVGPVRDVMNAFAAGENAIADAALKHPVLSSFASAVTGIGGAALQFAGVLTELYAGYKIASMVNKAKPGASGAGIAETVAGDAAKVAEVAGKAGAESAIAGAGGVAGLVGLLIPWFRQKDVGFSKDQQDEIARIMKERDAAAAAAAKGSGSSSYYPGVGPMSFSNDNSTEDSVYRGTLRAFTDFANGGRAGGGSASGIINADFITGIGGTGSASGGSTGGTGGGGGTGSGRIGIGGSTNGGFVGKGDYVALAEHMLGANGAQAAAMLHSKMTPGEWCADFVNGVIKGVGGQGVNSSMASAFATWGKAVGLNDAQRGDVILEQHGSRIGHVGLATGNVQRDAHGNVTAIEMVSGNYGHAVKRNWERVGIINGLRRGHISEAPLAQHAPLVIHNHTHLDGKIVAQNTTKHQARRGMFPTSVGSLDAHGSFASPGTPMIDAA